MPFNRLIEVIDNWAKKNQSLQIFAQIGNTDYTPLNIEYTNDLLPSQFNQRIANADIVIAHAGTGTIIKALQSSKLIFVMPRLASLNETRNDHQKDTVKYFLHRGLIETFTNEEQLDELFSRNLSPKSITVSPFASKQLLESVRQFISN